MLVSITASHRIAFLGICNIIKWFIVFYRKSVDYHCFGCAKALVDSKAKALDRTLPDTQRDERTY